MYYNNSCALINICFQHCNNGGVFGYIDVCLVQYLCINENSNLQSKAGNACKIYKHLYLYLYFV